MRSDAADDWFDSFGFDLDTTEDTTGDATCEVRLYLHREMSGFAMLTKVTCYVSQRKKLDLK